MAATEPDVVARLRRAGCVFAEEEARLLVAAADTPAALAALVGRRVGGEPLEHLLGWVEFCGLRLRVGPGVFVPRQRTALLVRAAVRRLDAQLPRRERPVVVDLCCGSGAVGAAVLAGYGPVDLYAVDLEPAAVACARTNLDATVLPGELYAPLPPALHGRVDLVVAVPPYVPTAEIARMPREARDHEPRLALDGGVDGLDVVRRIIAGAPGWLCPGGQLLVESSGPQTEATIEAVAAAGLEPELVTDDDLGATVVAGSRRGRGRAGAGGWPHVRRR